MDIKMIAVDLDGTLFRDDKTVSDKTIATLKKCRDKGIKVVYATARGHSAEQLVPGDDINDLDMLEFCGVGVAMGNAIDDVKAVADYICDTNENDGIAKWLEEYII